MDLKEQLKSLSAQDRKELLKQLQQEEKENKRNRRDAYEGLRAQFMLEVKNRLLPVVNDVKAFRDWVEKEAASFRDLMRDYGQLRKDDHEVKIAELLCRARDDVARGEGIGVGKRAASW